MIRLSFRPKSRQKEELIPRSKKIQLQGEQKLRSRTQFQQRSSTAQSNHRSYNIQKSQNNSNNNSFLTPYQLQQNIQQKPANLILQNTQKIQKYEDLPKDWYQINNQNRKNQTDSQFYPKQQQIEEKQNVSQQTPQEEIPDKIPLQNIKIRSQSTIEQQQQQSSQFQQFINDKYKKKSDDLDLIIDNQSRLALQQKTGIQFYRPNTTPLNNNNSSQDKNSKSVNIPAHIYIKSQQTNNSKDPTPLNQMTPQNIKLLKKQNENFNKLSYYHSLKESISKNVKESILTTNPYSKINHSNPQKNNQYTTKLSLEDKTKDDLKKIYQTPKLQFVQLNYYTHSKKRKKQQNQINTQDDEDEKYYKILFNNMTTNDFNSQQENKAYFLNQIKSQHQTIKEKEAQKHIVQNINNQKSLDDLQLEQQTIFKQNIESKYSKYLKQTQKKSHLHNNQYSYNFKHKKPKKNQSNQIQQQQQIQQNYPYNFINPKSFLPNCKVNSCFQTPIQQQKFTQFCTKNSPIYNSSLKQLEQHNLEIINNNINLNKINLKQTQIKPQSNNFMQKQSQ